MDDVCSQTPNYDDYQLMQKPILLVLFIMKEMSSCFRVINLNIMIHFSCALLKMSKFYHPKCQSPRSMNCILAHILATTSLWPRKFHDDWPHTCAWNCYTQKNWEKTLPSELAQLRAR